MRRPIVMSIPVAILISCLWFSSTRAESDRSGRAPSPHIVRLDPRFDSLIPPHTTVEKIADGFAWVEGPVWNRKEHSLLFSDIPNNTIFTWQEGVSVSFVDH